VSRRPCDVVGYAYRADVYCPTCVLVALGGPTPEQSADGVDVEATLDRIAKARGIGRDDERDFSSDDFPKVVFRDEASEPPEVECGGCGWLLIEQA
jgi:hypothetical protein